MRLATGRLAKHQSCIQPFGRLYDAVKTLGALVELFGLDPRFCVFGSATARSNGRPQPSIQPYAQPGDQAHAVMEEPPSALAYNDRVNRALDYLLEKQPTFAIIDKGRDDSEKSCIWMEKGNFYAMGYVAAETDLTDPADIRDSLSRCTSNYYSNQLIYTFAERYPSKVLRLDGESTVLQVLIPVSQDENC